MVRMQEVPEAEVQDIYNMVQYEQRSLHADQFNREYTKEEENRKEALRKEYENGRFPEGTLTLVENAGQVVDSDKLV